jgi:rhamnose transport system permease protein
MRPPSLGQRVLPFTHEILLAVVLLVLMAWAGHVNDRFLTVAYQRGVYKQIWDVALLALPMTFIIITGGIDLSVGAIMSLASVFMGLSVSRWGWPFWLGASLAVGVGVLCGLLNGLFVAKVKVHPLIVTLATMSAFRGLAEGISLPDTYSENFPEWLYALGKQPIRLAGGLGFYAGKDLRTAPLYALELAGWVFLALAVITAVVLWKTRFGRALYAIGFNETAARYSGMRTDAVKIAIYTFSGLVAGLVAINVTAGQNTAKADVGSGIELTVITAVVLGGTSIFGGRGRILGTLLGIALIHETRQFVSLHYQRDELVPVVLGVLLIVAVAANALLGRKASRR